MFISADMHYLLKLNIEVKHFVFQQILPCKHTMTTFFNGEWPISGLAV